MYEAPLRVESEMPGGTVAGRIEELSIGDLCALHDEPLGVRLREW